MKLDEPTARPRDADSDRTPRLVVNTKPAHMVECVAFDPSGAVLASSSRDMNIEIWDAASQRLLRTLRGHTGVVTSMAFHSSGELLASGGTDGVVRLWDVRSGQLRHALTAGADHRWVVVAFGREAHELWSACSDGAVRCWDITTGGERSCFLVPPRALSGASLAPNTERRAPRPMLDSDGGRLAFCDPVGVVTLWDLAAKEQVGRLPTLPPAYVVGVTQFSPDGGQLAAGYRLSRPDYRWWASELPPLDGFAVRLFDTGTGAERVVYRGHTVEVSAIAFDPTGTLVASADVEGRIAIWERRTGEQRFLLRAEGREASNPRAVSVSALAFHRDGEVLAAAEGKAPFWGSVRRWSAVTGAELGVTERKIGDVNSLAIDNASRCLAVGGEHGSLWLWPLGSGAPRRLEGHRDRVNALAYARSGQTLVSASWDCTARLWDPVASSTVAVLDTPFQMYGIAVSPDDTLVVTGGTCGDLRLWDAVTGDLRRVIREGATETRDVTAVADVDDDGHVVETGTVYCVAFSPDGRLLAEGGTGRMRLWDAITATVVHTMSVGIVSHLVFHPTVPIVVSGGFDQIIRIWDVMTGAQVRELGAAVSLGLIETGVAIALHPGGAVLASGGADGIVRMWEISSGAQLAATAAHTSGITAVMFDASGGLLVSGAIDGSVALWDVREVEQPRLIGTLYTFSDDRWAVIDPQGRFDASDAGDVPWLGWVVGMEPIALEQLKERYYEPDLLRKLLSVNAPGSAASDDEPLRDVPRLADVELYPAMEMLPRALTDPRARVRLTNRGGGIGRVEVAINGKEMLCDARGVGCDPDSTEHVLELDFSDCPLLRPGEPNACDIRVYNTAGYLVSRDLRAVYQAPATSYEPPHLWAIVAGISDYQGKDLQLRFAADDAEKIAGVLRVGGERLFGAERVHIQLLTTPRSATGSAGLPTRRNLEQAFAAASAARSTDVLVVFLAGHGTSHGARNDYYFLTADARSGNLEDPGVRSQTAFSSEELTALIGRIPALKQVLILDTCAAGTLIDRWSQPRALPSSQIRALDRMKDRMGLHILAGSAADRRAYESSKYGQGLLTYSLLVGMRGPALMDEDIVDVTKLFDHAVDQVPKLAGKVGGMQSPMLAVPRGGTSFSIGRLPAADRERIRIARGLPILVRAAIEDAELWSDPVGLSRQINEALRALDQRILLVDLADSEVTDAYRLKGRYDKTGDMLQLEVRVQRGTATVTTLSADLQHADLEQGVQTLVARLLAAIESHHALG